MSIGLLLPPPPPPPTSTIVVAVVARPPLPRFGFGAELKLILIIVRNSSEPGPPQWRAALRCGQSNLLLLPRPAGCAGTDSASPPATKTPAVKLPSAPGLWRSHRPGKCARYARRQRSRGRNQR